MIQTRKVAYSDSTQKYEGVVAYQESATPQPVIMIAHAYGGQSAFEENKALTLAQLGYVGFAIDVYGKGKRAKSPDEAQQLMDTLNSDRALLLERMKTSLAQARNFEFGDETKIGAIGFCFGGKCVLDLARSGASLKGAVSFHGLYDAPSFNTNQKIVTPLLILHGWDDPLAPPADMVAIANELTKKGADWEINAYGHTGHAFTNPNAKFPEKGLVYNQDVSDKAWARMKSFFQKAFEQ
ncbi:MAG: dienelactone hydrolase family protein [Cyclobacteriaceae bacterium]